MPKNKIEDLRNHLFEAIERLGDDEIMDNDDMLQKELRRATGVVMLSEQLVELAKVELRFVHLTNGNADDAAFFNTTPELGPGKGG